MLKNMQTILGANGQIAVELAKELKNKYTANIKLVSRNPKKVNNTDLLFSADLLSANKTSEAIANSDIVYFTAGLPLDTKIWVQQWPIIMTNVINACKEHNSKLVFFDNTYMYPQNDKLLTEATVFEPLGPKGKVRGEITTMLLKEIENKTIDAVICRAPEFYGPGLTKSYTNSTIFENIKNGKELKVIMKDNTFRTMIFTPDASKAMALIGNTPDAYNQTWHLPCDDNRLTYKQFINLCSEIFGKPLAYSTVTQSTLQDASIFAKNTSEIEELLPRYEADNLFDSTKFKTRFPDFRITTYEEGIKEIKKEIDDNKTNR